jgi:hypothetical protein
VSPQSTDDRSRSGTSCPTCGAPAQRGQLICLECGGRISLGYRRPPKWQVPAAIVGGVLLLAAGGLALALRDVSDDAGDEVANRPAVSTAQKEADRRAAREKTSTSKARTSTTGTKTTARRRTTTTPAPAQNAPGRGRFGDRAAPVRNGVAVWPARRNAHTVVLLSAEDRASATNFAKAARKAKVPAGVMRSDDYSSLSKGFYIVFVGVYRDRAQAERSAAKLGRRYPGSFPQFVNGAESRR